MVGILTSSPFILQVVWFTLLSFVVNFYMGTYFFWIKHLSAQTTGTEGDEEVGDTISQVSFDQGNCFI